MRLAESRGLSVTLLERGYDVDEEPDLERLRADLSRLEAAGRTGEPDFPRHTARALREIQPIPS